MEPPRPARQQQIQLADIGRQKGRAQQVLRVALVGFRQQLFEMIEIALDVAAELVVVFVFRADHGARVALIVGDDAADENAAVAFRVFRPQLLRFFAVHQPVEIDRRRIQILDHEFGRTQEHVAARIIGILADTCPKADRTSSDCWRID